MKNTYNQRLLALLPMCFLFLFSFSQRGIQNAEYFIDSDPGEGMAIGLSANDGNFEELLEMVSANLGALSEGTHVLGIRVQDSIGNWSTAFQSVVAIESPNTARDYKLTAAEYFWDADPGEGNANTVLVLDGNWDEALEFIQEQNIPAPGLGLHSLSLRFLGLDGQWSNTISTVISVDEPITARSTNIIAGEYFWGSDPGESNGTPLLVNDGNFDEVLEFISASEVSTPSEGIQKLSIRTQGTDGAWSNVISVIVSIETPITARSFGLSYAEYFWNSDPGEGNGSPLLVQDGNFNEALENINETGLIPPMVGMNQLNIRVKGLDDNWSNIFTTLVSSEEPITARDFKLTIAEYFWDTDPGQGNGIPMIAQDGNYNECLEAVLANSIDAPSTGIHSINLRFQDIEGQWSNVFSNIISVEDLISSRDFKITLMEFYFDTDPGFGSATPLLVIDGDYNEAVENVNGQINSALLTSGAHTLNLRTLGLDGTWGNTFMSVVYVDPCTSSPLVETTPSGPQNLCPNDSLLLSATPGLDSYKWYRNAQEIGQTADLWIYEPGYYYAVGYDIDGCPGASEAIIVSPINTPELIVTANNGTDLCLGESVTLTASGSFVDFIWNEGTNASSLLVDSDGDYSVTGITSDGCSVFSDTIPVVFNQNPTVPTINVSGSLEFCFGDSVTLSSSFQENNVWSTGDTTQTIVVYESGAYSVTLFNSNDCFSTSETVIVDVHQIDILTTPNGNVEICEGQTINIVADTDPSYNFQWLNNGLNIQGETNSSLNVDMAGQYAVEVTDDIGCQDTSSTVIITVGSNPIVTISTDGPTEFCAGDSLTLTADSGDSWLWNTGAATQSIVVTQSGSYSVQATTGSCLANSDALTVSVNTPLESISADATVLFLPNNTVNFSANTNGNIIEYLWDFGDGNTSTEAAPSHDYLNPGFYDVSLMVTDDNGCSATLSQTQWIEVWEVFATNDVSIPDDVDIYSVSFISSLVGCITTADGTVYATTDGGVTWVLLDPGAPGALNDIILSGDANSNNAIVVGDNGFIAVSDNGGPWVTPATGTSENLNSVYNDGINTYVVGDNETVLCFNYDTNTWVNISPGFGTGISYTGVSYYGGVLYVIGSNGFIYCYYGSGSWGTAFGGGSGGGGGGLGFGGGGSGGGGGGGGGFGVGSGGGGGVYTSGDGGGSWSTANTGNPGFNINNIVVINETTAICVGDHGLIMVSFDGGDTWVIYSIGDVNEDLTDVDIDGCQGFITGASGTIYSFNFEYELPEIELNFTEDLEFCDSIPVVLSVLNPRVGSTYLWSNGTTGSSTTMTTSGEYFVTQYDYCDTIISPAINVIVNNSSIWYLDTDNDGYGIEDDFVISCEQPVGYADNPDDCYPDLATLHSCCFGDVNKDGVVNILDLIAVSSDFGCNVNCTGDANEDGAVDVLDLITISSMFGTICSD